MIDYSSIVFERVKEAVQSLCTSISQVYKETPTEFPHVLVNLTDSPVTATDMENSECAVTPTFEITVYVKDSLTTARAITTLADSRMRDMEFQRILGPQQVIHEPDKDVIRLMTRYQRLIADGDTL